MIAVAERGRLWGVGKALIRLHGEFAVPLLPKRGRHDTQDAAVLLGPRLADDQPHLVRQHRAARGRRPECEQGCLDLVRVQVHGCVAQRLRQLLRAVRGERRKLAAELANLCAAEDTLLDCLLPPGEKPSQFLLPVRSSVLSDKELLAKAPLYGDLAKLLDSSTNPRAFRIGAEYRDWLDLNKWLIQSRLFE